MIAELMTDARVDQGQKIYLGLLLVIQDRAWDVDNLQDGDLFTLGYALSQLDLHEVFVRRLIIDNLKDLVFQFNSFHQKNVF